MTGALSRYPLKRGHQLACFFRRLLLVRGSLKHDIPDGVDGESGRLGD